MPPNHEPNFSTMGPVHFDITKRDPAMRDNAKLLSKMEDTPTPKDAAIMSSISTVLSLYHKALACKMYEVEELIDFYFHRRLAAANTVLVYYLTPYIYITPNQITLTGLVIGWAACYFIYAATFADVISREALSETSCWLLGSLLFFLWIVSDCSDGQVARLCKRGTRTGRIVDGLVDGLVLTPACFCFKWAVVRHFGDWWGTVAVVSGFSLGFHAGLYDKVKNIYMNNSLPGAETDGETPDSVHVEYLEASKAARETGRWGDKMEVGLLWFYHKYLVYQKVFGGSDEKPVALPAAAKAVYRERHAGIVRLASWLGISTHITAMYFSWALAAIYPQSLIVFLLFNIIGLNALHLYVIYQYNFSGMDKPEASNYASSQ